MPVVKLYGRRRLAFILAWALILPAVFSCSEKKPRESNPPVKRVVVTVYDGDTFVLSSGEKVRLSMIDAPETGQPYAAEAAQYLSQLVLGRKVRLKFTGSGHDRYGRILAEVYIDSINVAISLLKKGPVGFCPLKKMPVLILLLKAHL